MKKEILKNNLTTLSQHVILKRRDELSSILTNGGNMNTTTNYTTYTGTFVKRNGEKRTMTFIKGQDVPVNSGSGTTRSRKLSEGYEIVYDVEANGFRMFNWNTVSGTVSQGTISMVFGGTNS